MKNIVLCLIGFSEQKEIALLRIIELMSKKHEFSYEVTGEPLDADIIFFENTVPKDFPKDLTSPQLILSDGATYYACRENQHKFTWAVLESQIALIINIIKHFDAQNK